MQFAVCAKGSSALNPENLRKQEKVTAKLLPEGHVGESLKAKGVLTK
jgi:hypothetical protein